MSKTRFTALFAVLLVGVISLVAAGCGSSDDGTTSGQAGESTSESTEAETGGEATGEPITVGSDIPYPPFEEGKPGSYTGFDVELMEAVGKSIGREVEFEDTSFDTIFLNLAQGKFDAVASAATITDEREKRSTSQPLLPVRTGDPGQRTG